MKSENRRLAAILFADIQGYTSLMQTNEQLALSSLQKFKSQLDQQVPNHNGEIINFYGDGCLAIFNSSVDATACAKSLQLAFQTDPKVPVRIGLHAGDVVLRDDNVFGDAVNIASRIESMGVAGSVLLSSTVQNQIHNQSTFDVSLIGKFEFKNINKPMSVYALKGEGLIVPKKESLKGKQKVTTAKRNWTIPIALLSLAFIAFLAFKYLAPNSKPIPLSENNSITIFPFEVKGSQDLQYLGEGVVDLISTQLDDITAISAIDPNLVFNELKEKGNAQPSLDEATSMSRELGAGRFVLGNILVLNDQLEVIASKYDVEGQLLSKKNVKGKSDKLTQMIDELIRVLIADELDLEGMELAGTAAMTSQSLPALQEYLLGEQDFRKMKFKEAVEHYSKAIKVDSSFALSWMRIADAEGWMVERAHPQALQKANQYKDRLPENGALTSRW